MPADGLTKHMRNDQINDVMQNEYLHMELDKQPGQKSFYGCEIHPCT